MSAVVEGLPVQDEVSFESLELPQKERGSLVGDLLPDQSHVVQEDPKPFVREESSVQEQPARSNIVQEDSSFKGHSLVEPEPLNKQEEIDANKALLQIEPVSHLGEEVSEDLSYKSTYGKPTIVSIKTLQKNGINNIK